jgi:hypothetical protein
MRYFTLSLILTAAFVTILSLTVSANANGLTLLNPVVVKEQVLAAHSMPLDDRYANMSVNNVFKDNILLTVWYLSGKVTNPQKINWEDVHKPFSYDLTLQPDEVFAFHDDTLPQYSGKKIVTTNAHFDGSEGFESDGYLYGDGVCHLASLINWVGRDAGLNVLAPTNHDFARIPDVPAKYGTAIYSVSGQSGTNEQQNLYIENNFETPIHMIFDYENNILSVRVERS